MYIEPIKAEVVRRQTTDEGDTLTLYSDGTVYLNDDRHLDLSEIAGVPLVFDNHPGNVFRVVGDLLYVAGQAKASPVSDMMNDTDDEVPYHSRLYVLCLDWQTGDRVWDRDLGLGGATVLAVSPDHVFVAGFREYVDKDDTKTVIAKLDDTGHLLWQLEEEAAVTPHPTEIDLRPDSVGVYVDSFNTFLDTTSRFCITVNFDGQVQEIKTL